MHLIFLQLLEQLLPSKPRSPSYDEETVEEVDLMAYEDFSSAGQAAYDESDDEEQGAGPRVGCAQQ